MRLRGWVVLGMLAFTAPAAAQTVKATDLVGAWWAELGEPGDQAEKSRVALVIWPDGLWWFAGGVFLDENHGGARWRLLGDTLWIANDYVPYFHPMIEKRILAIQAKGYGLGVMDAESITSRPPFPVPDSVYWSPIFRDSTNTCADSTVGTPGHGGCATAVYKVLRKDRQLSLTRLDGLSRNAGRGPSRGAKVVLTRDSLVNCHWEFGCR